MKDLKDQVKKKGRNFNIWRSLKIFLAEIRKKHHNLDLRKW